MALQTRLTILIIDDEPALRKIYRDMFEHQGYEVLEARSGEAGWEIAKVFKPDLILLDILLPTMNGLDLLKRIRDDASTKNLRVIIFSILGEREDITGGIQAGADDYVVKGMISAKELSRKVYSLLETKHPTMNTTARVIFTGQPK